jgi:hypothetical protein
MHAEDLSQASCRSAAETVLIAEDKPANRRTSEQARLRRRSEDTFRSDMITGVVYSDGFVKTPNLKKTMSFDCVKENTTTISDSDASEKQAKTWGIMSKIRSLLKSKEAEPCIEYCSLEARMSFDDGGNVDMF